MQVGSQMDFFATFADLAGVPMPSENKTMDSTSMVAAWTKGEVNEERRIFFYRGNLLMAIRQGSYKMHLWTWTSPPGEIAKVGNFGLYIVSVFHYGLTCLSNSGDKPLSRLVHRQRDDDRPAGSPEDASSLPHV